MCAHRDGAAGTHQRLLVFFDLQPAVPILYDPVVADLAFLLQAKT